LIAIIEIILFSLFGLWALLIPTIFLNKIKYFKTLRGIEFKGFGEMFMVLNSDWWKAGFTWAFPIFGKDKDVRLNAIRRNANSSLYLFYATVIIHLLLVALLNKIS
jgi:hypothetical protein